MRTRFSTVLTILRLWQTNFKLSTGTWICWNEKPFFWNQITNSTVGTNVGQQSPCAQHHLHQEEQFPQLCLQGQLSLANNSNSEQLTVAIWACCRKTVATTSCGDTGGCLFAVVFGSGREKQDRITPVLRTDLGFTRGRTGCLCGVPCQEAMWCWWLISGRPSCLRSQLWNLLQNSLAWSCRETWYLHPCTQWKLVSTRRKMWVLLCTQQYPLVQTKKSRQEQTRKTNAKSKPFFSETDQQKHFQTHTTKRGTMNLSKKSPNSKKLRVNPSCVQQAFTPSMDLLCQSK